MTRFPLPVLLVGLLAAGCPRPQPKPNGKRPPPPVADLDKRLELPPEASTLSTLTELARRARAGDAAARWARLRYLIALYDYARLTGETPARRLLLRALGKTGSEPAGAKTTALVQDRLLAGLRRHLGTPAARDRTRAQALQRLLASDRAFARDPKTLTERLRLLKAQARGAAAGEARLRLYALCAQAFRVAARVAVAERARVLNHCLLPLFDFDATPHLRTRGAPPHPPWTVYRTRLQQLLDSAATHPRLSALVGVRSERDRRFYRRSAARLPVLLHDQVDDLPALALGRAYGGASALVLRSDQLILGGRSILRPRARHFRVALTEAFFAGNRGSQVTLFATRSLTMGRLAPVLERAAATGFYQVGFGGVQPVSSREGYWRRPREVKPLALREVVVSLAPISSAAATLKTLDAARLGWDRRCARHDLGVLLGAGQATAYGPGGRLAPSHAQAGTTAAMLHALSRLAQAFPTACAVRVSAEPGLPYATFLAALADLRKGQGAAAPFKWIGYAQPPGKPPTGNPFSARVATRLAARVKLQRWPRRMRGDRGDLRQRIRPCYLHALDTLATRWGLLEVHSGPDKALVSQLKGTSPEELALNQCIGRAVVAWRKQHDVDGPLRFRVQLKP